MVSSDGRRLGAKALPTFRGYTIDERLREFRRVGWESGEPFIEFIPFDSPGGRNLMSRLRQQRNSRE